MNEATDWRNGWGGDGSQGSQLRPNGNVLAAGEVVMCESPIVRIHICMI